MPALRTRDIQVRCMFFIVISKTIQLTISSSTRSDNGRTSARLPRALSLSLSPSTFPTVVIHHHRIRPLSLTFIHSLCNVQHHQHPLSILHAQFLQIPLFVHHLPLLQNINQESLHAVTSLPKKGDEDYVKHPENAFILFRQKCCEDRQQAEDGAAAADGPTKKQRQADLSKTISQQWKSLSAEKRQFWEQMAKDKKKEHEQLYPSYVYRF
jgi:HMG-box domain